MTTRLDKIDIEESLGADTVAAEKFYVGKDKSNGFFYSDSTNRTAFRGGDFYLQTSVPTFYNYAGTTYHGRIGGDDNSQKFTNNTLSGDDWSLSGSTGNFTTTGNIDASTFTEGGTSLVNKYQAKGSYVENSDSRMSNARPPTAHTHSYLPLSGGTMTGGVNFNDYYATDGTSYSVSITNHKPLLWAGGTLPNGGTYRFTAHVAETGTDTAATCVVWNQNGTWKLNVTSQSGTSSNNPEFIIENGVPTLITDHSSNYDIFVYGERMQLKEGSGTNNKNMFGADGFLGNVGGTLRFNPYGSGANYTTGNTVYHSGNLTSGTGASNYTAGNDSRLSNARPASLTGNLLKAVPANALFTDTTYSVGDNGLTQKNFTSTLKTKLDGIATNANNYTLPSSINLQGISAQNFYEGGVGLSTKYQAKGSYVENSDSRMSNARPPTAHTHSNYVSKTIQTGADLNTIKTSGFYRLNSTNSNLPPGTSYGQLIVSDGSDTTSQIALPYASSNMYFRSSSDGGNWNLPWSKVWNSNNDGAGSGLDADLLDGQHGSYYYPASNPSGYTSNVGDITGVTAGTGLTGGGTSGTPTLNVIGGPGITANANDIAVDSTVLRTSGSQTKTGNLTISTATPTLTLSDTNTDPGSYPTINFDTANNQGVSIIHNEFDSALPIGGYGLVVGGSASNVQFPTNGTLSFTVLGEIYAGSTTLSATNRVFHDAYHPNADKWTTARTLSLTGDVSGSVSWSGSANAALSVTVANDSHTHDGRYYTESESNSRYQAKGSYVENSDSRMSNARPATLTGNLLTAVPANAVFTDTTYSVGDNGLTQKNFTSTLKTKLDGIATNANNYTLPSSISLQGISALNFYEGGTSLVNKYQAKGSYVENSDSRLSNARPPTAHSHSWSSITSKPSTFAPSSHSHGYIPSATQPRLTNISNIGSGSQVIPWNNVTVGRPASGQPNEYGTGIHLGYDNSYASQITHDFHSDNLYYRTLALASDSGSWSKVWSSSNDGSGSGLDADLLDGYESTDFGRASPSPQSDPDAVAYTSGFRFNPHANNPTSGHYAISTFGNNSNVVGQHAIHYSSGEAYTRSRPSSVYGAWRKSWDSGNDGSGSGLDADLLDGQHGSFYVDYNNFTNTPSIPSLSGYATESYVGTQISNLVAASPGTLDTLNELAAALGDDPNFATTVTNSIATKLPLTGGVLTGNLTISKPDIGDSPAMTSMLTMKGYGGRGVGIKIRSRANSASNPDNNEWFIGSGYSQSGFNIGYSSTGNQSSYTAQNKFSINTSGDVTAAGDIHANGSYLFGDNKQMVKFHDEWLRINPSNHFTSGIFCGSGILRTDGQIQIGSGGGKFKVTSGGTVTAAGDLSVTGNITATSSLSSYSVNAANIVEGGVSLSTKYLGKTAKATDADKLDGVNGASYMRSDATDYQNNTIYQRGYLVNETGYRDRGVYGHYDSTKTNHIWSMGTSYKNSSSGADFGNLYGLAYKHTNNATGGTMAGGHQMVWCSNGTPKSAIGNNIWTAGTVYEGGIALSTKYQAKGSYVENSDSRLSNARPASLTGNLLKAVPANALFTDTTYSVGDNGLTQKNFTSTLKTKLDGIATSANNYTLPSSISLQGISAINFYENGVGLSTKYQAKGSYVENSDSRLSNARPATLTGNLLTAVPTGALFTDTTYSVGDNGLTQKNFTSTLKTKLDGIAANANNYTLPSSINAYSLSAQGITAGTFTEGSLTLSNKYLGKTASAYQITITNSSTATYYNVPWTTGTRLYRSNSTFKASGQGNLRLAGTVTSNYSDERLKDVIEELDNEKALDAVCRWRKVRYTANQLANELSGYNTSKVEVGLLANEIANDYPELITTAPFDAADDEDGTSISGEDYKTLSYERLVAIQAAAIEALNNKVIAQQAQIDEILKKM